MNREPDPVAIPAAEPVAFAKLQRDYDSLKNLCARAEIAAAEAQVELKKLRTAMQPAQRTDAEGLADDQIYTVIAAAFGQPSLLGVLRKGGTINASAGEWLDVARALFHFAARPASSAQPVMTLTDDQIEAITYEEYAKRQGSESDFDCILKVVKRCQARTRI